MKDWLLIYVNDKGVVKYFEYDTHEEACKAMIDLPWSHSPLAVMKHSFYNKYFSQELGFIGFIDK